MDSSREAINRLSGEIGSSVSVFLGGYNHNYQIRSGQILNWWID